MNEKKTGAELIAAERQRQIEEKLYDEKHDDRHDRGEMADAAFCYACFGNFSNPPGRWPWGPDAWKPTNDQARRFTKAGALYQAEIDRLTRLRDDCAKEIDTIQSMQP